MAQRNYSIKHINKPRTLVDNGSWCFVNGRHYPGQSNPAEQTNMVWCMV